jgi:hypothetical protein
MAQPEAVAKVVRPDQMVQVALLDHLAQVERVEHEAVRVAAGHREAAVQMVQVVAQVVAERQVQVVRPAQVAQQDPQVQVDYLLR